MSYIISKAFDRWDAPRKDTLEEMRREAFEAGQAAERESMIKYIESFLHVARCHTSKVTMLQCMVRLAREEGHGAS
jgi:hypothetical protein